MKVRFLIPAQSEVDDAVAWYTSRSRSLGTQFLDDRDRPVRIIVLLRQIAEKSHSVLFCQGCVILCV
jgi:hypothetical protein